MRSAHRRSSRSPARSSWTPAACRLPSASRSSTGRRRSRRTWRGTSQAPRLPECRRHRAHRRGRGPGAARPEAAEQLQEGFQRGRNGTRMIPVPVVSDSLQEPIIISASRWRGRAGAGRGPRRRQPAADPRDDDREQRRLRGLRGRRPRPARRALRPGPADSPPTTLGCRSSPSSCSGSRTGGTVNFEMPGETGSQACSAPSPALRRLGLGRDRADRRGHRLPGRDGAARPVVHDGRDRRRAGGRARHALRRPDQPPRAEARRGRAAAGLRRLRHARESAQPQRGRHPGRRLQPDGRGDPEGHRGDPPRAEENKELFVGSIRMLANAIDEKDPYTRGHSDRVAYYSPASPSISACHPTRWTASTSRASSTTWARSGSRTRSCARPGR